MLAKKETAFNFLPWLVWVLSALFYFYEFLLQAAPSVMVNDLMSDLSISATKIGTLGSAYFIAYAGLQIPAGVLLDKFGSKRLLTIACFTCSIGTFFFASAHSFWAAMLGRFFTGFGSAFAVIGCLNIAARWFKPSRFALLAGLTVTIGMLGAIFGQTPLALLIHHFGWRTAAKGLSVFGSLLALLIFFVIKDQPEGFKLDAPATHEAPMLAGLKYLIKKPQSWIVATYGGLMYISTTVIGELWGVPFLMHAYGYSRPMAASLISAIFFGLVFGSPFFGWLSDHIGRRNTPMLIAAIGTLLCLGCVVYIPNLPKDLIFALLFGFGFTTSGFILCFSTIREINPIAFSATSLGFTNMMNMVLTAAAQPLFGMILDALWDGKIQKGVRMYSLHSFHIALSLVLLMNLIALILVPFIKETYCQELRPFASKAQA